MVLMPVARAGTGVTRVIFAGLVACASGGAAACTLEAGPERTVTRVVSADTLQFDDGSRVRLANILTPRAGDGESDPTEAEREASIRKVVEGLAAGKTIRLRYDQTRKDRYGMTRAHVVLLAEGRETSLQALLVGGGHARVDVRLGERACAAELLAAEDAARANALGLWTESRYRVRAVTYPRDLLAYRGTFQIVSGTVVAVEAARDLTRLLFGTDRRRALSVSFRSSDRDILGPLGGDARALVGQTVEARGWIDQRSGSFGAPDIDVSLAGHVRLVSR